MRAAVVVPAGVVLILGAYALGRSGSGRDDAFRPTAAAARPVADPAVPEFARPVAREGERAPATGGRPELPDSRVPGLNDRQGSLASALAEGRITPADLLELFRKEQDGAMLDVLQGVLANCPEAADVPGLRAAFEKIARDDSLLERRQAAIAYLGSVWDRDGSVRETLLSLARSDGSLSIRLTALGTLSAYSAKNGDQAGAVNAGLLELARTPAHGDEVRTQAISVVEARMADEATVRRLSDFLGDSSGSVRLAAAERLAEGPPAFRVPTVAALEGAIARERDLSTKSVLLATLVKAGRTEAVAALERSARRDPDVRADAQDYLAILRAGFVDWTDIQFEKSKRETAAGR